MSQNPVLPEENTEEIKNTRTRRTRKTAKDAADAPDAEKKTVRRRKSAAAQDAAPNGGAEEKKSRRTTKKSAAAEDFPAAESSAAEEAPSENARENAAAAARKTRTRKAGTSRKKTGEAPAEEEIIHLGSALVLDDMLPPFSLTPPADEEKPAPEKKRRTRKTAPKAEEPASPAENKPATESAPAADSSAAEQPAEEKEDSAASEKKRSRRSGRKNAREENVSVEERSADAEEEIIHLGSALVLDDMLPPFSLTVEGEEEPSGKGRRSRRSAKDRRERSAQKAGENVVSDAADDDIGNRADAPSEQAAEGGPWFDDGVVTNILPYPGEFPDDSRAHSRSRKNRRNRDAQPASNGSPYLPGSYQQGFYDQTQALVSDNPFGGRNNRKNRKNRRNQSQVPVLPDDFDFNAAMLNDSVLGVALGRREDDFLPEDDGPQPALPGQPVALPLAAGDLAEEDLAALDAAVNGNRIDMPASPQQKEGRQNRRNKKVQKEEKNAPRAEKKAEQEEAAQPRRVLYVSVVPDEQVEVVITEDGQVTEYFVEMAHQVKIRGNIYKGVINNIDTNLQAAFVNFGNGKNGFLQIDEVHPEYYLVPHDPAHGPKYPPIQKVLKVGQEVLVQVVKEPSGSKGAFLTTWISIAGRFLVLTPGQEQIGVSRKVEDPEERARLKDLLNGIQPGENMGVIIRTARSEERRVGKECRSRWSPYH